MALLRIPLDFDPTSATFIAVAAPTGGLANMPALVKGDPGDPPTIDTTIDFTALAYDDASPDSAVWTETSPGTFKLSLELHKGQPGDAGSNALMDASDLTGTPLAGKVIVVNSSVDGFQYATQSVGDVVWPADYDGAPVGSSVYTVADVSVAAQDFPWRPHVEGQVVLAQSSTNVRCDLIARLGDPVTGNVVGRGFGTSGSKTPPPISLASGPPAGSSSGFNRIEAGSPAVVYLRVERQSGTGTFSTNADTTWFSVEVRPIP